MKYCNGLTFKNKQPFFKIIDNLPTNDIPDFQCELIDVEGSCLDTDGNKQHIILELFKQDPVRIVKTIVGDPTLCDCLHWEPVKLYANKECTEHIFNEAWTGDDWFNLQVSYHMLAIYIILIRLFNYAQSQLPPGATVAPVILASDSTWLLVLVGDKTAWPVYITIGNVAKHV